MAQMNIINIVYLFFRLAPFIIVSYFTLNSVFNQDLKGLVYILGLLIACSINIMLGRWIPDSFTATFAQPNVGEEADIKRLKCNMFTLGENGPLTPIPLGQMTLSFTLAYLAMFIGFHGTGASNIPTLIVLPLMIIGDMIWNLQHGCSTFIQLSLAFLLGAGIGSLWGFIIESYGNNDLLFLSGKGSSQVCARPQTGIVKCKPVAKPN